MSKDFYKSFEKAPYPCFWLGGDGTFWANEAAGTAKDGAPDSALVRALLDMQLRSLADGVENAPSVPCLPADALRLTGLTALPVQGGIFATLQNTGDSPIAAFSTQLREPLTNIYAILPLVAKKLEDEDLGYLEAIQSNCYTLLRLASNLESAGRLENQLLSPRVLDLGAMVDSLCFCVSSVCKEQGVTIQRRVPEAPVLVAGDEALLSGAILNLIRNALQYTRDGNTISVKLYEAAGRAVLTVEDKGLGIKPEHMEHIFTPYYSVDPYGDGERPGLGLGLSIAQQTARALGGSINAESRYGEGTRITMALPLAAPSVDEVLYSDPADYLLNRYSAIYVQLCGLCRLPVV